MRNITASQLGRVAACPASNVLPAVFEPSGPAAERGNAIHRYLYRALKAGRDQALREIADHDMRVFCSDIDLKALEPYTAGSEAFGELAIAYDVDTDTATVLGEDIGRAYGKPVPGVVYMSLDLVVSGDRSVVLDYKTGAHAVPHPAVNWQLRVAALAVRALHRRAPLMVIAYVRDDGTFAFEEHQPDAMQMDEWAEDLAAIVSRVAEAEAAVRAGRTPDVSPTDAGCRWCPCQRSCPAHVSVALALRDDRAALTAKAGDVNALAPAEVAAFWEWLQTAKSVVEQAESAIEVYALHTPIPLPDGRVLKAVTSQRESIDAEKGFAALKDRYGPDIAAKCITPTLTKTGLSKALRGPEAKRALEVIRGAGGVTVKEFVDVKAVKA